MSRCCASCIGDKGLLKIFFPALLAKSGECFYCSSQNVLVLSPHDLADVFAPLANIYECSEKGKPLAQCLSEDWGMFECME